MKIRTSDLISVTEKLFEHLHKLNIEYIELPYEYYWDIPKEYLYDSYQEPVHHTLGQLSDDWSDLEKVLGDVNDPLAHDFVDLAAILKALGQTVSG